jgi:hypothetical protein
MTMVNLERGKAEKFGAELLDTQNSEANSTVNNSAIKQLGEQISTLSQRFVEMRTSIIAIAHKAGTPMGEVSPKGPKATTPGSSGGAGAA